MRREAGDAGATAVDRRAEAAAGGAIEASRAGSNASAIDSVLPQTQCRQCGFAGCRPYAEAIATGRAEINQCPPGGDEGIARIAALVGRPPLPLDTTHGLPKPFSVALIDEAACIGCTLCIQACPVDAIVGGARRMHDVVADLCSGCELCLPPCPVDCITMVPADVAWDDARATAARRRHDARALRLTRLDVRDRRLPAVAQSLPRSTDAAAASAARRQATVAAAIERARRLQKDRVAGPPRDTTS